MTHPLLSRWLRPAVAIACGAVLVLAVGGTTVSKAQQPRAIAAGEDSPWPRTNALKPNVRALRREVARLDWEVERMEQSAEHAEDWITCIRYVPVNELGDRDRQSGYLYDERDGTGVGHMDGIAVDRRRKAGKEDYLFMHFRGSGCRSDNPQPGGTAEPASVRAGAAARPAATADACSSARPGGWPRGRSGSRPSPSASTSGSPASRGSP